MERKRDLAASYQQGAQVMAQLHGGDRLRAAAAEVRTQLPAGPVSLCSTSIEGAAIAAVCAAGRPATNWDLLDLTRPAQVSEAGRQVVFVEPIDAGRAWRDAIAHRFPEASVIIASGETSQMLQAA